MNIKNAEALVFLRREGQIQGIAALKCPLASYRTRISKAAKAEITKTSFPYELGYIFLIPEARGKNLSGILVTKALDLVPGSGVFATARTDNHAMLATLEKTGFEPVGEPYGGRGSSTIRIFVWEG